MISTQYVLVFPSDFSTNLECLSSSELQHVYLVPN
jgi:hypothetical protein